MADTAEEERLTRVEARSAKLEGIVEARERDLISRLQRLEGKVDRIPWFIFGSWVTIMVALIGGLYLR